MESNFFEITIEIGGYTVVWHVTYEETIESLFSRIRAYYSLNCKELAEFFSRSTIFWTLSHRGINLLDNYSYSKQKTIAQCRIQKGTYLCAFQTFRNDNEPGW